MRIVAVLAFLGGLLLAVRVMFFGVQRKIDEERLAHRRWPLALAAFLTVSGAILYATSDRVVTPALVMLVLASGLAAGAGAWWLVQRSASIPSTDPEDDPRFRFQGHVARVVKPLGEGPGDGRITFEIDGRQLDLDARWSVTGEWAESARSVEDRATAGGVGAEVVIEVVEGTVAYVEPWKVVEERL